eukprot:1662241-Karenia_brevis.AAC.1
MWPFRACKEVDPKTEAAALVQPKFQSNLRNCLRKGGDCIKDDIRRAKGIPIIHVKSCSSTRRRQSCIQHSNGIVNGQTESCTGQSVTLMNSLVRFKVRLRQPRH